MWTEGVSATRKCLRFQNYANTCGRKVYPQPVNVYVFKLIRMQVDGAYNCVQKTPTNSHFRRCARLYVLLTANVFVNELYLQLKNKSFGIVSLVESHCA